MEEFVACEGDDCSDLTRIYWTASHVSTLLEQWADQLPGTRLWSHYCRDMNPTPRQASASPPEPLRHFRQIITIRVIVIADLFTLQLCLVSHFRYSSFWECYHRVCLLCLSSQPSTFPPRVFSYCHSLVRTAAAAACNSKAASSSSSFITPTGRLFETYREGNEKGKEEGKKRNKTGWHISVFCCSALGPVTPPHTRPARKLWWLRQAGWQLKPSTAQF